MIDCHAHLTSTDFDSDRAEVLERASRAGVTAIVCVCEKLDDVTAVLALARDHRLVHACLGLHPEFADLEAAAEMCRLIRENQDQLAAIGEVGLDYWLAKENPEREIQRHILREFATLSVDLNLPLNVHSRSAGHYTIDLLQNAGATAVLMHAFDGKASYALAGVESGFLFSIPPSIVRSPQKQKLVRRLPLENILLETDSPVLGPQKGERNEPANVTESARMIAEIKTLPIQEVVETTSRTAATFFQLLS